MGIMRRMGSDAKSLSCDSRKWNLAVSGLIGVLARG